MGIIKLTVAELEEIYKNHIPIARSVLAQGNISPDDKALILDTNIDFYFTEADIAKSDSSEVGFVHDGKWFGDFEVVKAIYEKGVQLDREDGIFDGSIDRDKSEIISIQYRQEVNWNNLLAPHLASIFAIKRISISGASSEGTAWVVATEVLADGKTTRHYCVTNAHVVDKKFQQEFKWDIELKDPEGATRNEDVTLVGVDHTYDTAVFYFDSEKVYPALPVSELEDLNVDDPINVVGNQQGYGVRPNPGHIISVESYVGYDMRLFQDNSQALDGNSGSPVFDQHGMVIGMTNSGPEGGVNFSIPISYLLDSYRKLREDGKSPHGYDGFMWQHLDNNILSPLGIDVDQYPYALFVQGYERESVQKQGTVQRGDIILKYDGNLIPSERESSKFSDYLSRLKPGSILELLVYREGEYKTIKFKVEERIEGQVPTFETEFGFSIQELSPQEMEDQGVPRDQKGVAQIISYEDSNGDKKSFIYGIIWRINDTKIDSVQEFINYVDHYRGETFVFFVRDMNKGRIQDEITTSYNKRFQKKSHSE